MSENVTTLLAALVNERVHWQYYDADLCETGEQRIAATDAALAAVEQELAALEAERAELKKRPTNKEVTRAIWEGAPFGLDGNGVRIEVARNVDRLFDEKAAP